MWRTVTPGVHKSAAELVQALSDAGFRVSDRAKDIMSKPAFTISAEAEVRLVHATVAELGFPEGAHYAEICVRIKELGHRLCPAEVGPVLCLQYTDQPFGGWLNVAMEPLSDSDGNLSIFAVSHGSGGLWLGADWGNPGSLWVPNCTFVFVLGESR